MRLWTRNVLLVVALGVGVLIVSGQAPQQNNPKAQASEAPNTTVAPNEAPNANTVTSVAIPSGEKIQTFVGKVSDVNCGPRHFMLENATDAECTRACFARRGLYALVVGDKVYSLVNQPGAILNQLAGKQARVTGSLMNPSTIEIASVSPAGGAKQ